MNKTISILIALLLAALQSLGQVSTKDSSGKKHLSLELSNYGLRIDTDDDDEKKKKKRHKKRHVGMNFDFGINNVIDNTNYAGNLSNRNLVVADTNIRALIPNDLELRNGKSINFNFWPVWIQQDIAKHNVQIETGLGFQFFNYRYESTVRPVGTSLLDEYPIYEDVIDPNRLKGKQKNKLGVSYVSIPLMIRFNSNSNDDGYAFTFAAGVIGSYKLKSWSKFYGEKESGNYGLNDWMTQASVEIGVPGILKLYGTYALQSMYEHGLDRTPFAIGIRL